MKRNQSTTPPSDARRGSTLVIVIAMMGLLAFTGTVFYLFAAQERSAAEYFAESAKDVEHIPDDPMEWGLRQVIIGATPFEKFSALGDTTGAARHSVLRTMVGPDITPHTGAGIRVAYDATGLPIVDQNYDLADDVGGLGPANPLNFADSIGVWGGAINEGALAALRDYVGADALPHPDVDYSSPDINTPFLAYKGLVVRDNGAAAIPRFELVPVIIPSFFRPQYMKSSLVNDETGTFSVPTDADWWDDTAAHGGYLGRSYRAHPAHVGGFEQDGTPVRQFLDGNNPADAGLIGSITAGPFPFRPGEGDNSADFGKLGIQTGHDPLDSTQFELDSDNDGDGIKEGVWMYLAYPIEETPGGRFYATLHSFTIYDLDGLINLNVHGNLAGLGRGEVINASILGGGGGLGARLLSRSNLGLGPNEISPMFALRPTVPVGGAAATPFVDWFGAAPLNAVEQANMEWLWLLTGRFDTTVPLSSADIFPGRWGDSNALVYHKTVDQSVHTLPRPGRGGNQLTATTNQPSFNGFQGFDDNADGLEGVSSAATGTLRGFVHPLDYLGLGSRRNPADFRLPQMVQDIAGRPEAWLGYLGYSALGSAAAVLNDSLYIRGRDGIVGTADDLMVGSFFNVLFEDPLEMIVDLDFALRPDDQMFSVQEMLIGHLTSTDVTSAQTTPSERLKQLLPSTFEDGSDRSERFTTLSHSLRQVPFLQQPGGIRGWEWSADSDGDGAPEFPPSYGQTPFSLTDPFRPEVRRLLTIEAGEQQNSLGQLLLSVNHILDINRSGQVPPEGTAAYLAWLQKAGMRFRPLIEHPAGSESIGGSTAAETISVIPATAPTFPPQTIGDREFWARRDRQKLARDIFVLLYTLSGAEDGGGAIVNYTADNSGRLLYSNERLRQMAQFAVNMVDALDTDNVITQFEYDKNLGNGWNLDDNTSTDDGFTPSVPPDPTDSSDGMYPLDSGDRGVVFGVEAQQLAFSEVLAVHSPDLDEPPLSLSDDPVTEYDDTDEDRYFLHVELQNILPVLVELASTGTGTGNEDQGTWRLARFDRASATDPQDPIPTQTLTLMEGNPPLAGGDRFTIATAGLEGTPALADPTGFGTADIYVDSGGTGNFDLISPDVTTAAIASGATPVPHTSLDTVHTSHDTRWLMTGNSVDKGQFVDTMLPYLGNDEFGITATGASNGFDLVLQRRLNPNLPQLPIVDNPWVEVDRVRAEFSALLPGGTLDLTNIKSLERREVLDGSEASAIDYASASDPAPTPGRENTMGSDLNTATNDGTPVYDLWQAHFDRDFASSGELLNLPIVGPKLLTRSLDRMRYAGFRQSQEDVTTINPATQSPNHIAGAAGMILQPDFPDVITANDNRWYRLLQFVEVPSRVNRMLGNYINLRRLPGRMNVNMIRHRDVYAGFLDDFLIANTPTLFDSDGDGALDGPFLASSPPDGTDASPGPVASRDRWLEFVNERDGYVPTVDPVSGLAINVWMPGMPNSRPFRSMAYTTGTTGAPASLTDNGLDETLLRRLGQDLLVNPVTNPFGEAAVDDSTNRHWLEPGDRVFHDDPGTVSGTANMVHRHQFLSKIMNNTTTVSNSFIVYATAAYFEAVPDPTSGVFRIGGRMGLDLDGDGTEENDAGWERRAVFVIDRTELFNAFDPASGEFEWERLVKTRLDLASDGQ